MRLYRRLALALAPAMHIMAPIDRATVNLVAPLLLLALGMIVLTGSLPPFALAEAPSLVTLQNRFDHEENSIHRAKLIQKLGDVQFEALHTAEKAGDYNAAGLILEKYRDNVRSALLAMKKQHPDAERQSAGYKQLQMHVHRGIREVEEALIASPDEFRPPLQLVRADLIAMDDEMLKLLFPASAKHKDSKQ